MSRSSSYWAVLGAALFYAITLVLSWPQNVLSWDIFGYYLYLPASVIYGDLSLQEGWLAQIIDTYQNSPTLYQLVPGVEGKQVIKYPIGWAILNLPFFLLGHIWALISNYPADGFSKPYQWSIVIGSYTYVVLGLWILRNVLQRWIKQDLIITITILTLAIGTNLLHASVQATAMSHTYLFALYALFLWMTQRDADQQSPSWQLGAITGLLIITRNSEIVVIPLLLILFGWGIAGQHKLWSAFTKWKQFLIGLLPVVAIQMAYWWYTSGSPVLYAYDNAGEGFDWLQPHTWNFLFSFRKGWLLYTPIMIVSLIGIRFFWKQYPKWGLALAVFTVANIYLLSTWTTWWYAASFGQRSMVQSYALLAVPLGFGIAWAWNKQRLVVAALLLVFVSLNLFQTWQYGAGIIDQSRMTHRAYIDHFWRTEPLDEAAQHKLLIQRSATAKEQWPTAASIQATKHVTQSFESDSGIIVHPEWKKRVAAVLGKQVHDKRKWITNDLAYNGKQSFQLDQEMGFSPAIRIPYDELTQLDYVWVEASAWVKSGGEPLELSLVVTFDHNGGSFHYRTTDISLDANSAWQQLTLQYLTPEIRSASDELTVYVWNRNGALAWVDEVQVQVYEDLNPVGQ